MGAWEQAGKFVFYVFRVASHNEWSGSDFTENENVKKCGRSLDWRSRDREIDKLLTSLRAIRYDISPATTNEAVSA